MSEHYPENSIGQEVLTWCEKCRRQTKHVIVRHSEHAGKLGHCLEHNAQLLTKKQEKRRREEAHARQNPVLF